MKLICRILPSPNHVHVENFYLEDICRFPGQLVGSNDDDGIYEIIA